MRLLILAMLISFGIGVMVGHSMTYHQRQWNQSMAVYDKSVKDRFRRIQRKHGVVAVATDWSHCFRLNGEVIRLNKEVTE